MANAPFVIQPELTALSMAYRNTKLVADQVLRRMPVNSSAFKWTKYTQADAYTVPNTFVGRKGRVNEIDWTASEQTSATADYGLEDPIPTVDIENAQAAQRFYGVNAVDPRLRSTQLLTDLIALDREVRVANLVTNAANYATANKTALSGTSQWSDFTNSDPIGDLSTALDVPLMRPNKLVLGRAVATILTRHPKIVKAFNGGIAGDQGIVPINFLATLFGLDQVIVGEGWVNTAKKGQTPAFSRVWGKSALLFFDNPMVEDPLGGVTYGFTGQWGQRIAGTFQDPEIGLRGGERVRVGESVVEIISAADVAYLFSTAVA